MNTQENSLIGVKGIVTLTARDIAGNIVDQQRKNLVVNVGKRLLANLTGGLNGATAVGSIAVGDDNTAASSSDTLLGNEIYREACTASLQTTTTTDDTVRFSVVLDEGDSSADGALVEAGLFGGDTASPLDPDDGTGNDTGVLLSHVIFAVINKTAAISLTIDWDIIFQ